MISNIGLPSGASYELYSERIVGDTVRYDGNRFERIDGSDRTTMTARVQYDGKMSIAGGSKPGSEENLIKKAFDMVAYGSPCDVPFVGETEIKPLDLLDKETLTSKQMIEKMGAFVEDIRSIDSRLTAGASLSSSIVGVSLQTSYGFNNKYSKSGWTCVGHVELVQGDDLLSLYEYKRSLKPDFDLAEMKKIIAQKLEYAKTVVPMDAGAFPVIFAPSEAGNIINPIVASLNGQAIYRKVSPWTEKLGEVLLDKRFTLTDEGALDKSWASKPFDLEGTPTKNFALVQNGCLSNILLDRKVASKLGKESSGNAGAAGPVANFVNLESGSKTLDELIKSIDYGLLIDGTMGAWSGNPFAGIVSGTISMGLKIEKGKIVGRVKDCMFTINAFEHFKNHLIDFSIERDQTGSAFFSSGLLPYIALDEVVISAE